MDNLRVAFIVGGLNRGGAEKQFLYMAKSLHENQIPIRVYVLEQNGIYESDLEELAIETFFVGKHSCKIIRIITISKMLRDFNPTVIQSTHFHTNLYSIVIGKFLRIPHIGAMRSNLPHSKETLGYWTPWLIRFPSILIVNSMVAYDAVNAHKFRDPNTTYILPNVIDLGLFDQQSQGQITLPTNQEGDVWVIYVGRLEKVKQIDGMLHALALARQLAPNVKGVIVGRGSDQIRLETMAKEMGLLNNGVWFLGERSDVPMLLRQSHMLLLCSQDEGFPNVILEAMAASLPVITTPAGDAPYIVEHNNTGFILPYMEPSIITEFILRLAASPDERRRLGKNGRKKVENFYSYSNIFANLMALYKEFEGKCES